MQRALHYIVSAGIAAGVASMLYFLCLAAGLGHIALAAPIALGGSAGVMLYARRLAPTREQHTQLSILSLGVFAMGMAVILFRSLPVIQKYGGWDAWAMWNFHAKFLRSPHYWTMMFDNGARAHPDYPLFIPSFIALLSRLCGSDVEPVSYALHLAITLAIPALVFMRYQAENLFVASAALLVLATSQHYVAQGVSMYADTALPFFLLCAILCLRYMHNRRGAVAFAALALGCCAWTKNEGLLLAAIFIALHPRELFAGGRAKFFAAGVALPVITLVIFKGVYAPANDMVSGVSEGAFRQLSDPGRYWLIWSSISDQLSAHFAYMKYVSALLVVACLVGKRLPDKNLAFVAIALIAYVLTYALTYLDLEWHLRTSMERLLHQLMPIAVFSVAGTLASSRLPGLWRNKGG